MPWNLPNFLTVLRIALIPGLVGAFYFPPLPWANYLATFIFVLGAITDWLDGWLARRYHQTTRFGAFLDPVADKLMVVAALVLVLERYPNFWLAMATLVIVGREITVSALREWMAEVGQRGLVAVSKIGKIKTTTQMIALILLLFHHPISLTGLTIPTAELGLVLLGIAAVITLWSMIGYLRAALPWLWAAETK